VTDGTGLDSPRPARPASGLDTSDGAARKLPPPRAEAPFAHASEAEMARILDFYAVRWEYEPHTFPILWNLEGAVVESFAPDFYLPDLDVYLEMTTLKQRLVRKKNRKLRRLRELYPNLRIKLFYARDFRALMLKYGKFGVVGELSGTPGQVISAREQRQVAAAAAAALAATVAPAATLEPRAPGPLAPPAPPARPVEPAPSASGAVPRASDVSVLARRSRSARRRRAAAARRALRSSTSAAAPGVTPRAPGDRA